MHISSGFFLSFLGIGIILPQIGPFLFVDLGFEDPGLIFLGGQIGACLGAIVVGYRSDKSLNIRSLQMIVSVPLVVAYFFIASIPDMAIHTPYKFYLMLFLWSFGMFCLAANLSLGSVAFLQNEKESFHFGRVRLYGTFGFCSINICLSFLDRTPTEAMSYAPYLFLLSSMALFLMPWERKLPGKDKTFEPEETVSIKSIYFLLRHPRFLFFWIILFLFYFHFSPAEYIVSVYVQKMDIQFFSGAIKLSGVALAWSLATITETIFLFFSPYFLKKIGIYQFTILSFIAGIIRFGLMMLLPLDIWIVYLQALHGVQFGSSVIGAILYIEKITPPRKLGTALALMVHLSRCLGTGLGAFYLSGFVEEGRFSDIFLISVIVGLIGLIMYFFYWMVYINGKRNSKKSDILE